MMLAIPEAIAPRCVCGQDLVRGGEQVYCPACGRRYEMAAWPQREGDDFRLAAAGELCRRIGIHGRKACSAPAVLALRRDHAGSVAGFTWWAYCAEHTYGRVVVDGQIWWAPLCVAEARGMLPLEVVRP